MNITIINVLHTLDAAKKGIVYLKELKEDANGIFSELEFIFERSGEEYTDDQ